MNECILVFSEILTCVASAELAMLLKFFYDMLTGLLADLCKQ